MRVTAAGVELHVNLVDCEAGDPCSYDHTCRIHKLYGFLKSAGAIDSRVSIDGDPPTPAAAMPPRDFLVWARVEGGKWAGFPAVRYEYVSEVLNGCTLEVSEGWAHWTEPQRNQCRVSYQLAGRCLTIEAYKPCLVDALCQEIERIQETAPPPARCLWPHHPLGCKCNWENPL